MVKLVVDSSVALKWFLPESDSSAERTIYDMLYLALALHEECHFVTADQKLFNALPGNSSILTLESWPSA